MVDAPGVRRCVCSRTDHTGTSADHGDVCRVSRSGHARCAGCHDQHLSSGVFMAIAAGSSLRRFRSNKQVQAFLRGIAPAVVGLLVAAAVSVGRAGIHTWVGLSIMLVAIFILVRFRPNAFWVILGAGVIRLLFGAVGLG